MPIHQVSFIGVGRMGEPMAAHLLQAGYRVTVHDLNPAPLQRLARQGAITAINVQAAAQAGEAVITMLPTDEALQDIAVGSLLDVLTPRQVFIDMSTSRLATSRRLAKLLGDRRVAMLDAPVTGGESGAQAGTLTIMVGGEPEVYARCEPVLKAMASKVTHVGPQGHGLIAKYVNQMIMESMFGILGEAFSFAESAGADKAAVYEAIRTGMAASPLMDMTMQFWLKGDFGTGRELTLHTKDGAYALAAAEDVKAWTPFTALSHELYKLALRQGDGERHAAALALLFERANK